MTTLFFILIILTILGIGFIKAFRHNSNLKLDFDFAFEYRNKFLVFANKFFETYERFHSSGNFDNELYVWLTKNVSKIQGNIGYFGVVEYIAPFQTYKVSNYQIIINTLPKFRDGNIEKFDITSVDDCLLRYLGDLEEMSKSTEKNLKNPFVWFRIGFQEIISIPILILNWFGIFSTNTVNKITGSTIFKIFTGIIALITLISGIVTILQGKEKLIEWINKVLGQ